MRLTAARARVQFSDVSPENRVRRGRRTPHAGRVCSPERSVIATLGPALKRRARFHASVTTPCFIAPSALGDVHAFPRALPEANMNRAIGAVWRSNAREVNSSRRDTGATAQSRSLLIKTAAAFPRPTQVLLPCRAFPAIPPAGWSRQQFRRPRGTTLFHSQKLPFESRWRTDFLR